MYIVHDTNMYIVRDTNMYAVHDTNMYIVHDTNILHVQITRPDIFSLQLSFTFLLGFLVLHVGICH